jgi:hypothetical protein
MEILPDSDDGRVGSRWESTCRCNFERASYSPWQILTWRCRLLIPLKNILLDALPWGQISFEGIDKRKRRTAKSKGAFQLASFISAKHN